MSTTTREGLKEYCLRGLGAPVIEINVEDEQLEDRIDEALEYWRLYHPEGIETVYLKQQITASRITLTTSADVFELLEVVTGQTSNATATVVSEGERHSEGNDLFVYKIEGTFIDGETLVGSSGTTAILSTNAVTKGIWDNRYIQLNDLIYGVVRVLPFSQASSSKNMFDLQYQLRLHDLYDVSSTSIIYYKSIMNHISLLDFELNTKPDIRFNRLAGKLYLDVNWSAGAYSGIQIGDFLIVETYRVLDPTTAPKMFNEIWLKHYTTALFKRQWAINLKKYQGLQLPGGVTLDGQSLYDEAISEIKDLEDDLMTKSAPLSFYMG